MTSPDYEDLAREELWFSRNPSGATDQREVHLARAQVYATLHLAQTVQKLPTK